MIGSLELKESELSELKPQSIITRYFNSMRVLWLFITAKLEQFRSDIELKIPEPVFSNSREILKSNYLLLSGSKESETEKLVIKMEKTPIDSKEAKSGYNKESPVKLSANCTE
jgi:hypothetical protein